MAAIHQIISNSNPAFDFEEPASAAVVSARLDDDDQSTENGGGDVIDTETYRQALASFSSISDEARMVANPYGVAYEPAMLCIAELWKRLGSIPEVVMAQRSTWLFASSDDCRFLLDVSVLISPDRPGDVTIDMNNGPNFPSWHCVWFLANHRRVTLNAPYQRRETL
jgi:hypothetical protein